MSGEIILINDFPFPTSVNESLTVARGRMIKTRKARHYKDNTLLHYRKHKKFYDESARVIKSWLASKEFGLKVDAIFIKDKSEILTKTEAAQNMFKQCDVHNRTKQLHDALFQIFDINDCNIINGSSEVAYAECIKEPTVCIIIQKAKLKSKQEALDGYIGGVYYESKG